jgi:hypothetical protein
VQAYSRIQDAPKSFAESLDHAFQMQDLAHPVLKRPVVMIIYLWKLVSDLEMVLILVHVQVHLL